MNTDFKKPRLYDSGYLVFLRTKPCCVCGSTKAVEAAHVRMGLTGTGRKPNDSQAVPLCAWHHRLSPTMAQHNMGEAKFWERMGHDPFQIAIKLYTEYGGDGGKEKGSRKITPRKPREERAKFSGKSKPFPSRPLQGRSSWPSRKTDR